jgi:hypothetical protein
LTKQFPAYSYIKGHLHSRLQSLSNCDFATALSLASMHPIFCDSLLIITEANCRSIFRCDGKKSCRMSVNSNVFGDPCPGTHKYVEVHYACSPLSTTTTTRCQPYTSVSFVTAKKCSRMFVPGKPLKPGACTIKLFTVVINRCSL